MSFGSGFLTAEMLIAVWVDLILVSGLSLRHPEDLPLLSPVLLLSAVDQKYERDVIQKRYSK